MNPSSRDTCCSSSPNLSTNPSPPPVLTAPRGHITGPRQYGLTLPGHRRTLSGPPLPPPASLPVLPDPTAHTMSVEVGTPGTPGTTPTQPLTHHFHATPDHATVALQAMNKLRMNSQVRRAFRAFLALLSGRYGVRACVCLFLSIYISIYQIGARIAAIGGTRSSTAMRTL